MNSLSESSDNLLSVIDENVVPKQNYDPENHKVLTEENDLKKEDSESYLNQSYVTLWLTESWEIINDLNIEPVKDRLAEIENYYDSIKDIIKNSKGKDLFNEWADLIRGILSNIKIKAPWRSLPMSSGWYLNSLLSLQKDRFPENILAEVVSITKRGEQYIIKQKWGSECIVTLEQPNPNLPNDKKVIFVSWVLEVTVM